MVGAVGYAVEAVPRPENLETVMISDELLNLCDRVRRRHALCAVAIIPSPVDQGLLGPGDRYAIDHPRHRRCTRHARTLSDELTPAGIHHREPSSASRPCGGWIIVLLGRVALQQTIGMHPRSSVQGRPSRSLASCGIEYIATERSEPRFLRGGLHLVLKTD